MSGTDYNKPVLHKTTHEDTGADEISVDGLAGQLAEAQELAWPIGSVFLSVVSTDPSTLLGFGTWSAIAAGRVLVGIDAGQAKYDTVEEEGGDETQTPSAHAGATVNDHAAKNTDAAGVGATQRGSTASTLTLKAHVHNITLYTHTVGQANNHSAMSIVQPYFVVYMWKRTA